MQGEGETVQGGLLRKGEAAFFIAIMLLLSYCGYSCCHELRGLDLSPQMGDHGHEPR